MGKTSVAPKARPKKPRGAPLSEQPFPPELFRYEAFNGHDAGGLTTVLHALETLSRLSMLAQRGLSADADVLVGDAELLDELATAVGCAAMHARAMHGKAVA
ncbi:MAG: hypothetical protein DMD99_14425 [Candidatus Rokuibacteriota bacterium]|nr:MAG: hypothetical protein DMD99_14425 [Candidatus Rokubacteria bacterium]